MAYKIKYNVHSDSWSRVRAVSMVTKLRSEWPAGADCRQGKEGLVLDPTHHQFNKQQRLSLEIKRPGRGADHTPPSRVEVN